MGREVFPIINGAEMKLLEQLLKPAGGLKHKHAVRVQAVLGRAWERRIKDLAVTLCAHPMSISAWVRLFNEKGAEALVRGATRAPGKAPVSGEVEKEAYRSE